MENVVSMKIPIPTSLNKLYCNQYIWDNKRKMRVPTGKRVLTAEGEACKKEIQRIAKSSIKLHPNWDFEETKTRHLYIDMTFVFQRTNMDADNTFKLMLDSLQGIVFFNDSNVLPRPQRILYCSKNPRVYLKFKFVDYIGIFDNIEMLDKFNNDYCYNCRRYSRNCSILKRAKEGRLQDEIDRSSDGTISCNSHSDGKNKK